MDYKEKYNKLVEAIKVLQETNPSDEGIQNWVNENVPELAESEDEKIRKALIGFLKSPFVNENITDEKVAPWIDWLEKQGTSYTKRDVDDAFVEGMAFAKDELEKQGKQKSIDWDKQIKYNPNAPSIIEEKPAWSEDDENVVEDIKDAVINTWSGDTQDIILDWLKSLKQRIGG